MKSKTEVTENRIESWADLYGDGNFTSVIVLHKNESIGYWTVGSSVCLPSDIQKAAKIMHCYLSAFHSLELKGGFLGRGANIGAHTNT